MANPFIILAEDNPDHADLVKLSLKSIDFDREVIHLEDGEKVIDFIRCTGEFKGREAQMPDLILLDVKMPKKNGLETLEEIKKDEKLRKIPVIMLTSSDNSFDINFAYNNYANSYLKKPVDFQNLKEILTEVKNYWLKLNKSPQLQEN